MVTFTGFACSASVECFPDERLSFCGIKTENVRSSSVYRSSNFSFISIKFTAYNWIIIGYQLKKQNTTKCMIFSDNWIYNNVNLRINGVEIDRVYETKLLD